MYILYTIAYTAICIPQTVMLASVTDDEQDRLETNMFGTLGTNIGQLLVGALTITLVSFLGAGSEYKGYQHTIIIFATVGVLLLLTCFKNSRERITQAHGEKITAKEMWDLDNERKNELEKIGIKTFYIWELDYNENFDVKKFIVETLKIEL